METTNDPSHQILAVKLVGITGTATVTLPSLETMRRKALPVLSQVYQEIENGNRFLLFNSGFENPQRVIIFSFQQAIQFLSNIG